jgi:hypothetical protein
MNYTKEKRILYFHDHWSAFGTNLDEGQQKE